MSEFHFGVGYGRVAPTVAKRIHKIAKQHDAWFIVADMPEGPQFWFSTDNCGSPFDEQTASAVFAALEKAGLWPVPLKVSR